MSLLFVFLCTVILGYVWLTDAQRVRAMASSYLSELLGGQVTIGKANLSIFEGLRLDDVTLRVDRINKPDSIIFHARTFLLHYHVKELLAGKLSATQIVAIDPMVMLVEDPVKHTWNYQRLWNGQGPPKRENADSTGDLQVLPQILLRDAEVAYLELRAGKTVPAGWYSLEGNLEPSVDPGIYDFSMQSRGREAMGPSVDGTIRSQGWQVAARLQNFTFGPDIKTMLLAAPRQWCESHELQGRVDVPAMTFSPGQNGKPPSFRAELVMSDVELAMHPSEWMSREQNHRVQMLHDFLEGPFAAKWLSREWIDNFRRLSTPEPIHLRQVSGTMIFTENGIELKYITGKIENNWLDVNGKIDGYTPDAAAQIALSSVPGHDLEIPEITPDYLGSLPKEAQDVIEHLHPRGICSVALTLDRPEAGGKPTVSGRVDVHDGQFRFSDFPYPISRASGEVIIGDDPIAKIKGIRIINVQGHGPEDGANANATVSINGFIGPIDGVAGVQMEMRGTNFHCDRELRAALPPEANNALNVFDPTGSRELPQFSGSFVSHLYRPIGPRKPWSIATDLMIEDASGMLAEFPYPIEHFSGRLEIRAGYLNLVDGKMPHAGSVVGVSGRVTWKDSHLPPSTQPYGPDLHLVARDFPIDGDLVNALPAKHRQWLQKAGISGKLDVDGHIFTRLAPIPDGSGRTHSKIEYSFNLGMHDAAINPDGKGDVLSDMTGNIVVTPDGLAMNHFTGRRGAGKVTGRAMLDWAGGEPSYSIDAAATNLRLDESIRGMLSKAGQEGWDSAHPVGTVDANLQCDSKLGSFELNILPRDLTLTPAPFPYRLDSVKGMISISPKDIELKRMTAKHGDAEIALSGKGTHGNRPEWDLKIAANQIAVNDELMKALPEGLRGIVGSLKLGGKIGLELSKLDYWPNGEGNSSDADASAGPALADASAVGADADFAAKLTMEDSSLDIGLPAENIKGTFDLAGLIRDGKLYRLAGTCNADSLTVSKKPASDFKLSLSKAGDEPVIHVSHLDGKFIGGDVAGEGQFAFPNAAPSTYEMQLVLRDADVQQLTTPYDKKLQGRLTASLQMGGSWDSPESRRGHGSVIVAGDEMYNIPVMLGLLQITNLQLPVNSPFTSISTRYTLEGQKVILEQIELKNKSLSMTGSGNLDFAGGQVSLWLVTNNSTLVALPVVGELIHGADNELLKIHIKGTIDKPKVSASAFDTITTTVDQVFNAGDGQK